MITKIKACIARMRYLRRAHDELVQCAYEATTPERFEAGYYDIKRAIRWRYQRVTLGYDLNQQMILLTHDIGRLYINTAQAARERLGAL